MAPKQTTTKRDTRKMNVDVPLGKGGGRGNRGVMQRVLDWRRAGKDEHYIRDQLKKEAYKAPRIRELVLLTFEHGIVKSKNSEEEQIPMNVKWKRNAV